MKKACSTTTYNSKTSKKNNPNQKQDSKYNLQKLMSA